MNDLQLDFINQQHSQQLQHHPEMQQQYQHIDQDPDQLEEEEYGDEMEQPADLHQ